MTQPTPTQPVLKPETVYSGDNGRLLCLDCAGMSAKWTGRDLSGHAVERIQPEEIVELIAVGAEGCECGAVAWVA